MAKIKLGYTPEQVEKEVAKDLRERELEVQRANRLQNEKLFKLIQKEKINRILVIIVAVIILLSFTIFGTYNTFFKSTIKEKDVVQIIKTTVTNFPTNGLDGYIRNNFKTWFDKYVSFPKDGENGYAHVRPILSSFSIDNVVEINSQLARAHFSIEIETKRKDKKLPDGKIEPGVKKVNRYSFVMPIEYQYNYIDDKPVSAGYVPVGRLSFYVLKSADSIEEKQNETVMLFTSEEQPEMNRDSAKIKIDKILNDAYSGRDISQDFISNLKFNVDIGATYVSLDEFKFYKEPNKQGYNATAVYTIQTKDGFKYQNKCYLAIFNNGTTWTINGMQ